MSRIKSLVIIKLCVLGVSLFLAGCSSTTTSPYSPRVAVMGDDSEMTSLPRSSGAFRAVATEINNSLVNEGFLVVDEQAIASNLGVHIDGRRSKTELRETIKLMNTSPNAANHAQVAVVYMLTSSFTDAGFGGKVSVMVDGELYDLQSDQFIDSFALPRKTFPAPANCNRLCQEDIVRENARDIASGVGGGLARQLRRQVSRDAGYRQNQTSAVRSTVIHSGLSGLISMYTLTFKHIPPVLVNDYMRDMEGRCAGHVTFDLLYANPAIKRYSYSSKANTDSVYRCLARAIDDRGLRTAEDVLISQTGSELIVEKITSVRPNSSQRFN